MKKLFSLLLLSMAAVVGCYAQSLLSFAVQDFAQDQFDNSPNDPRFRQMDGDGNLYAIIKVKSNNPNDDLTAFRFNFGNLEHRVVPKDNELWLYVQKNARRVSISREGYVPVDRYELNTTIQAGKCYKMTLSCEAPEVYSQNVCFTLTPAVANASIILTGVGSNPVPIAMVTNSRGQAIKGVPYGVYTYQVVSENYYPSEGRIELNDNTTVYQEAVTLRPNFSEVTLIAGPNDEIYVDNERKGTGTWTGNLRAGYHNVDCRREGHRETRQMITVHEDEKQTVQLQVPQPIYGSLYATSEPSGAQVFVDGVDFGVTPCNIPNVLVGNRNIQFVKDGFNSENVVAEVHEGQAEHVNGVLNSVGQVLIESDPEGAAVFIANMEEGVTPFNLKSQFGDYKVRLEYPGYRSKTVTVYVGGPKKSEMVKLKKIRTYFRRMCFYLQPMVRVVPETAFGGFMGFNAGHFNMEWNAFYSTKALDTYILNSYNTHSSQYYEFNCLTGGVKFGSRFKIRRLGITPQIGAGYAVPLAKDNGVFDFRGAIYATGSVRVQFAFNKTLGIVVVPECRFKINSSLLYDRLAEISDTFKAGREGFSLFAGLYLEF